MFCVRKVIDDLYWVGGNDNRLELFENIHPIPRGVSYNSYVLLDEKTVVFDTVDWAICRDFLRNVESVLDGRTLDYMVINHVEPDHCAAVEELIIRYPNVKIICTEKAVLLMKQFGYDVDNRVEVVKEGDTKSFGKHVVTFVEAPMVHWPEAMVTYDTTNGVLFAADAFGSFGALNGKLFNDEVNFDRDWIDDARRYYTNIVGKYGAHVQALLKKAGTIDIKMICPLHGPIWRNDFGYILDKYTKWSTYEPEDKGVIIVYASMYGNTEYSASTLATALVEKGITNVQMYDVSNTDLSTLIAESFRVSHIVLASVTYNLKAYPLMQSYLADMKDLNLQKRTFGIMENGSWACKSGSIMREFVEEELRDMTVLDEQVTLLSSMTEDTMVEINALADSIIESMK